MSKNDINTVNFLTLFLSPVLVRDCIAYPNYFADGNGRVCSIIIGPILIPIVSIPVLVRDCIAYPNYFADGNGSVCRIIIDTILMKNNCPPIIPENYKSRRTNRIYNYYCEL
jgi:hypothetical protein